MIATKTKQTNSKLNKSPRLQVVPPPEKRWIVLASDPKGNVLDLRTLPQSQVHPYVESLKTELLKKHKAYGVTYFRETDFVTQKNPNDLLTSHDVGRLLQMDSSSVVKWVNDGILPAYRTPGGHRRIRVSDLVTFLMTHGMYVPEELK